MPMKIVLVPIGHGISGPLSGAQNRYRNLANQLRLRKNELIWFEQATCFDVNDRREAEVVTYKDWRVLGRPISIARDLSSSYFLNLLRILKRRDPELIYITYLSGILSARIAASLTGKRIRIIYDAQNVESEFAREVVANDTNQPQLARAFIPIYTSLMERIVCKFLTDRIVTVSERDRAILITKYGLKPERIRVVPSGCNIGLSHETNNKQSIRSRLGIGSDSVVLFFHGLYAHPSNREALDLIRTYIAPRLAKSTRDILFLVGGNGVPVFKEGIVQSIGYVKDLQEVLSIVDIAVVPLIHGAGTKLKVLDYLSKGLPIVTTAKGAEGLEMTNLVNAIILPDVNEDFIRAIEFLVEKKDERIRLGDFARKLAEERYDWRIIGSTLERVLEEAVNDNTADSDIDCVNNPKVPSTKGGCA
jgi:glycosyltransferase involved in cell wall biosynthesis